MSSVITATNLTAGTSNTSASSFVTASITPSANKLILIGIIDSNPSAVAPTGVSGCSLTWVQVAQVSVAGATYMTVYRAMGTPTSGTLTISFGSNVTNGIAWAVDQINNTDTTGTNGSGAIVQSATNSVTGTQTGLTVTLGTFKKSINATWGVCGMNTFNYGINSGSNFTNLGLITTGGAPINSEYAQGNQTSVNWTWSSGTNPAAAVALEINAPNFINGMII